MTALTWDPTTRPYHSGVDRCVLYFDTAVAWNGVVSVVEEDSAAVVDPVYLDGIKVLDAQEIDDFSLSVSAFTYPSKFDDFITLQGPKTFGFSYRTQRGAYTQIHLVYNVTAIASDKSVQTLTNSIGPSVFNWTFLAKPVSYQGIRNTAHFILDSEAFSATAWAAFQSALYGDSTTTPAMPAIADLYELLLGVTMLRIIDNNDGTWTAIGPSAAVVMTDATHFAITWDTITIVDADNYTISTGY